MTIDLDIPFSEFNLAAETGRFESWKRATLRADDASRPSHSTIVTAGYNDRGHTGSASLLLIMRRRGKCTIA